MRQFSFLDAGTQLQQRQRLARCVAAFIVRIRKRCSSIHTAISILSKEAAARLGPFSSRPEEAYAIIAPVPTTIHSNFIV